MFALIVLAAVIVLLAALAGPAYPQSWATRWGPTVR